MSVEERYRKKIIADLKNGSQHAFKIIYDMYAPKLFSYAFSLTKSRDDASDLVQEVFVKLWESRGRIDVDKSFESFLFVIGRNLFISAYRKRMSSQHYVDYVEYLDSLQSNNTASSAIEFDEYRSALVRAFRTLSARQQQIVKLSKWKGMKNSEIAKELNLSEQTVKNQLSLGLKELRLSLAKLSIVISLVSLFTFK